MVWWYSPGFITISPGFESQSAFFLTSNEWQFRNYVFVFQLGFCRFYKFLMRPPWIFFKESSVFMDFNCCLHINYRFIITHWFWTSKSRKTNIFFVISSWSGAASCLLAGKLSLLTVFREKQRESVLEREKERSQQKERERDDVSGWKDR